MKKLKNPGSPMGRKDWEGRTPNWHPRFTAREVRIILEWAETFFLKYPGRQSEDAYHNLHYKIMQASKNIAQPLTTDVAEFPLFEDKP